MLMFTRARDLKVLLKEQLKKKKKKRTAVLTLDLPAGYLGPFMMVLYLAFLLYVFLLYGCDISKF